MSRMRGNGHVGDAEETTGSNFSDLKTIEVLQLHLCQDPFQRALYLLFSKKPKKHGLDCRGHEKEIPSRGMDLAFQGECIDHLDAAPLPSTGLSFKSRKLRHSEPL